MHTYSGLGVLQSTQLTKSFILETLQDGAGKGTPVTVRDSGGKKIIKTESRGTYGMTYLLTTRKYVGSAPGLHPHAPKSLLPGNALSIKPELVESPYL